MNVILSTCTAARFRDPAISSSDLKMGWALISPLLLCPPKLHAALIVNAPHPPRIALAEEFHNPSHCRIIGIADEPSVAIVVDDCSNPLHLLLVIIVITAS